MLPGPTWFGAGYPTWAETWDRPRDERGSRAPTPVCDIIDSMVGLRPSWNRPGPELEINAQKCYFAIGWDCSRDTGLALLTTAIFLFVQQDKQRSKVRQINQVISVL